MCVLLVLFAMYQVIEMLLHSQVIHTCVDVHTYIHLFICFFRKWSKLWKRHRQRVHYSLLILRGWVCHRYSNFQSITSKPFVHVRWFNNQLWRSWPFHNIWQKLALKRVWNLNFNVNMNRPSAKGHGGGHWCILFVYIHTYSTNWLMSI